MNSKYIELFREIAHTTEILSERVHEMDYEGKNEDSQHAAEILRKDYGDLYDRMRKKDFDSSTLTRQDFIRLLVGTNIVIGNLSNQVKNLQNAINGYSTKIMPLLQKIYEETTDDESARKLAEEIFQIDDSENPNN